MYKAKRPPRQEASGSSCCHINMGSVWLCCGQNNVSLGKASWVIFTVAKLRCWNVGHWAKAGRRPADCIMRHFRHRSMLCAVRLTSVCTLNWRTLHLISAVAASMPPSERVLHINCMRYILTLKSLCVSLWECIETKWTYPWMTKLEGFGGHYRWPRNTSMHSALTGNVFNTLLGRITNQGWSGRGSRRWWCYGVQMFSMDSKSSVTEAHKWKFNASKSRLSNTTTRTTLEMPVWAHFSWKIGILQCRATKGLWQIS